MCIGFPNISFFWFFVKLIFSGVTMQVLTQVLGWFPFLSVTPPPSAASDPGDPGVTPLPSCLDAAHQLLQALPPPVFADTAALDRFATLLAPSTYVCLIGWLAGLIVD
jgi:hypothetical protein